MLLLQFQFQVAYHLGLDRLNYHFEYCYGRERYYLGCFFRSSGFLYLENNLRNFLDHLSLVLLDDFHQRAQHK